LSHCFHLPFALPPCRDSYTVGYTVDRDTGEVIPDPNGDEYDTFATRMSTIWANVAESRSRFERAPDTGILGKRFSRGINIIWNYVFKGFFGSLIIGTCFPILCILNIFLSIFLSLTSALWVPLLVFGAYFFELFVYDFVRPGSDYGYFSWYYQWKVFPVIFSFLWKTGIFGVGSLMLSLGRVVLCLFAAFALFILSCLAWFFRTLYDGIFLNVILKPLGRVPATDSFLAVCLSGPGNSYDQFEKIIPEHALLLLQLTLEDEELGLINAYHSKKIQEPFAVALSMPAFLPSLPLMELTDDSPFFFFPSLSPSLPLSLLAIGTYSSMFSFFVGSSYSYPAIISDSCGRHSTKLAQIMQERRRVNSTFQIQKKYSIKMTSEDLDQCYEMALVMVEKFVTERIFGAYKTREEYFRDAGYEIVSFSSSSSFFSFLPFLFLSEYNTKSLTLF